MTENIRWVQSITLEGERLSADDLVIRRDMLAGARVDSLGLRLSFIIVAVLLVASATATVSAFEQTLQFFEPDYTLFALSLVPLVGLAFAAFALRPRTHFTLILRDGSALCMVSRDANFLTLCLEAFERLWSDPVKAQSALYLHAGHRSVDFGPSVGAIETLAKRSDDEPLGLSLPVFGDELAHDDEPADRQRDDDDEPFVPPFADDPQTDGGGTRSEPSIELELDDLIGAEPVGFEPGTEPKPEAAAESAHEVEAGPTDIVETQVSAAVEEPDVPPKGTAVSAATNLPEEATAPDDFLPARVDVSRADNDLMVPDDPAPEPENQEPEPDQAEALADDPVEPVIPANAFVRVQPKVMTLVRLLRERAPTQGISDAVDIMDLMTRKGCATVREAQALARAVDVLRERMTAYPAAIELLDEVVERGQLDQF